MTYYADLTECSYFGAALQPPPTAVGWLQSGHAFSTGVAPDEFVTKLAELTAAAWQPLMLPGIHLCDLCPSEHQSATFVLDGKPIALGCTNVFVPYGDTLYVAPSLVLHYIARHSYLPPE